MADNVSGRRQPKLDIGQPISREKGMKSSDASVYKSSEEVTIESKISGMASGHKSSDECYDYDCNPCKGVGDNAEAEGFCTDCEEYLCSSCFRAHSRSKLSKNHVLLGKGDLPSKSPTFCHPCKTAGKKIVAVEYCEDCCDFLCDNCLKSHSGNLLLRHHVIVENENTIENVDFGASSSIATMNIKEGTTGGEITNEDYSYVRDIKVKSDVDKKDCFITGMTLVPKNEIVLCDSNNKCLKLADIDTNIVKDILALQSIPVGITTISYNQIALTLNNSYQIQIVTTRGGKLTLERTIKTSGNCVSVEMINKHLYVSVNKPLEFQILKPTGAIIKIIKPDDEALKHCTLPAHIAVSPDESVIYVSDWQTNKVLSLSMNGNMIAVYQEVLYDPCGIIISPSGSVYVCNRGKSSVYKMTSDLREATVILGLSDRLLSPQTMCLDTDNKLLYISIGNTDAKFCNNIKVYKC